MSFNQFENIASSTGMHKGRLLRIILPFDEETSSNDQSLVKSSQQLVESIQSYPVLLPWQDELLWLRKEFSAIRRLVRVKIADTADYNQVKAANFKCLVSLLFH